MYCVLSRVPPTTLFWYYPCWQWERVSIRVPIGDRYSKDDMQSACIVILVNHKIDVSMRELQDSYTWILFAVFILTVLRHFLEVSKSFQRFITTCQFIVLPVPICNKFGQPIQESIPWSWSMVTFTELFVLPKFIKFHSFLRSK